MPDKPTVLVVDDDDDVREVTQLSLSIFAGWNVLVANGGRVALEIAQAEIPDAVLLDMMMPEMDGLTTLAHLKANDATKAIPVVLLTAKSQVGALQPWHDQPIEGVIAKPFTATKLAAEVAELLGWPPPVRAT